MGELLSKDFKFIFHYGIIPIFTNCNWINALKATYKVKSFRSIYYFVFHVYFQSNRIEWFWPTVEVILSKPISINQILSNLYLWAEEM